MKIQIVFFLFLDANEKFNFLVLDVFALIIRSLSRDFLRHLSNDVGKSRCELRSLWNWSLSVDNLRILRVERRWSLIDVRFNHSRVVADCGSVHDLLLRLLVVWQRLVENRSWWSELRMLECWLEVRSLLLTLILRIFCNKSKFS